MCSIPSFVQPSLLGVYTPKRATTPDLASGLFANRYEFGRAFAGMPVLLWACKSPLPYSHRCPTLFQPMHSYIDVVGSIQGLRQRVEQTHSSMVLRSRSGQFSGWASIGMVKANVTLNGTDLVSFSWPTTSPRSSNTTT